MLLALPFAGCSGGADASSPPNIVFLLVDDLRWDFDAAEGGLIRSPALHRLAAEGLRFERAFVTSSLCSPSRASFLTGVYPHVHGVLGNDRDLDYDAMPTLATLLKERGYRTAMIGKWHLGRSAQPRPGYDRWFAMPGQGRYVHPRFNEDGVVVERRGYNTDILTREAVAFVRENADAPFFLHLGYKAVHEPRRPAPRHRGRQAGRTWPVHPSLDVSVADEWRRRDAETLMAVDESVAAIYAALAELGILDDTVVVFTSDNGFLFGEHRMLDKRVFYEESIRIPWILRYPRRVEAGAVRSQMALNIDLAPTLLELAGAPIPPGIQGRSLVPALEDGRAPGRTRWVYEYFREPQWPQLSSMFALRSDRYKYVIFPEGPDLFHTFTGESLLFDLQEDPYELRDVAGEPAYADVRSEFAAELEAFVAGVDFERHRLEPALVEERVKTLAARHDFFAQRLRIAHPEGWPPE